MKRIIYKNEKEFTKDYNNSLKKDGFWTFKIPDVGFTLKPCDIIALKDGKFYAIELKIGNVDTYKKIYKKLRPNQVGSLFKIKLYGGISLVVGYDTTDGEIYKYDFKLLDGTNNEL